MYVLYSIMLEVRYDIDCYYICIDMYRQYHNVQTNNMYIYE